MDSLPDTVSSTELPAFNRCRLFHRVVTVSDVTLSTDFRPRHEFLQPTRSTHWSSQRYSWPHQGCPGPQDWAVWRRLLSLVCSTQGPLLGSWLWTSVAPLARFSPRLERLYLCCPSSGDYRRAPRLPGRPTRQARLRFSSNLSVPESLPPDSVPASIYTQGSTIGLLGTVPVVSSSSETPTFLSCHPAASWALLAPDLNALPLLLPLVRQGCTLLGVSDGSVGLLCGLFERRDALTPPFVAPVIAQGGLTTTTVLTELS